MPNYRKSYKSAKKAIKKFGRGIKKRYVTKSKKGLRVSRLAQDVLMLKSLVNVEKKRLDVSQGVGVAFGLNNGAANGFYTADITPQPAQGTTNSTRNGNSLKLVSCCVDLQIKQAASTVNQFRYKWFIVTRPDANQALSSSDALSLFFETNPFTGFIDYHSNRDPEYFHVFRVIKSGRGQLSSDKLSSQVSFNQIKIPLKLNHHLKYNNDISTTTTKNQFYLFIVSDTGSVTANTGALAYYNCRFYYTDN